MTHLIGVSINLAAFLAVWTLFGAPIAVYFALGTYLGRLLEAYLLARLEWKNMEKRGEQ